MSESMQCWICYSDSDEEWVRPCQCSLVCHESCLLYWIAENEQRKPWKQVRCPQCASTYQLAEKQSLSLSVLNVIRNAALTAVPYVGGLCLGGSLFISATTYGAYTVLTLFGNKQTEQWMNDTPSWAWKTWITLPAISVALVASQWKGADLVLPSIAFMLPHYTNGYPSYGVLLSWLIVTRSVYRFLLHAIRQWLSWRIRSDMGVKDGRAIQQELDILHGRDRKRDVYGLILSALMDPVISRVVGSYLSHSRSLRRYLPEPIHRNIVGGCLYVLFKDVMSLYYRYERIQQFQSRHIGHYRR
ncbi:hypothetical protein BDB01DRAFT_798685 [Pilobolus umbonatus]|nr:hypothetical protein BDB01DRAFT_798685 [Pilobolus umbonatus]